MDDARDLARKLPHPYCLRCYAPMEPILGASAPCPACGHTILAVDQELFWTLEPWLRWLERGVKLATLLLVVSLTWSLLRPDLRGLRYGGVASGWAIGGPILFGVVLWDTASKLTQRQSYFRASLFWSVAVAVLGVLCLVFGFGLLLLAGERSGAGPSPDLVGAVLVACGLSVLALSLVVPLVGRRYERWLVRRILRRSARRSAPRADLR